MMVLNESNFVNAMGSVQLNSKRTAGTICDGRGNLTFGLSFKFPAIYSLNAEDMRTVFGAFNSAVSQLPEGSYVQILDFYHIEQNEVAFEKKQFSTKYHYRQFDGKAGLKHRSFVFVTFEVDPVKNAKLNYSLSQAKRQKNPRLNITEKSYQEYIKRCKTDFASFAQKLQAIKGAKLGLLSEKNAKTVITNYMDMSFDQWNTEMTVLQPVANNETNLIIGNKYVGTCNLVSLPDKMPVWSNARLKGEGEYNNEIYTADETNLPRSFAFPVGLGLPVNHVISTVIGIPGKDAIGKRLTQDLSSDTSISYFNPHDYGLKKAQIKGDGNNGEFFASLSNGNYVPCTFSQQVFVTGDSQEEVFDHQMYVKQAYQSMEAGMDCIFENKHSIHFYLGNCPGLIRNQRISNKVMTVDAALTLLPRETHEASDKKGHLYMDRSGNALTVDMKTKPLGVNLNNQNKLIFGASGGGKSVFLNDYLSQCYNLGYHFMVIDVGGSYKRNALQMGLRYIDSNDIRSFRFNPFLVCPKAEDGTFVYRQEVKEDADEGEQQEAVFVVNSIYAVIDAIIAHGERVDGDSKIGIKKAIVHYYDHLNDHIIKGDKVAPNLKGFYKHLDVFIPEFEKEHKGLVKWESVKLRLTDFVSGENDYFLNAPEVIDVFDDRGIIIDAEAVNKNDALKNVAMVCICQLAMDKLEKLPKQTPKAMVIDEAVDFLVGDVGEFIGGLYRKIRKTGGEVIIATQDAKFLRSASQLVLDSILGNADTKILLAVDEDTVADARLMLQLKDDDMKIIESMKNHPDNLFREVFFKFQNKAMILRVRIDPRAMWVYTTHPTDRVVIDEAVEKFNGDVDQAVEYVMNNKSYA